MTTVRPVRLLSSTNRKIYDHAYSIEDLEAGHGDDWTAEIIVSAGGHGALELLTRVPRVPQGPARDLRPWYDAGMRRSSTGSSRLSSSSARREEPSKPSRPRDRFWQGFEQEVQAYLAGYPQEQQERDRFAGTSADRLTRER